MRSSQPRPLRAAPGASNAPGSARLRVEALEPRILHSADVSPLAWNGACALQADAAVAIVGPETQVSRSEIVFVDAGLPDAQSLIADLQAQQAAGRAIEVVTIGSGVDGIALISDTLSGRHDIGAVHVLAHGGDGVLQLGNARLDTSTLLQRGAEVAGWSAALTNDADLLLYGCDVAQTSLGRQYVQDLAALTAADVAASIDITGAAAHGGNWSLEYDTGRIDAAAAISVEAQRTWAGTLPATFTSESSGGTTSATTIYNFSHNVNSGSDRLLLVTLVIANGVDASAVDFNGNALTFLARQDSPTGHVGVEIWYLVAPPVVSGTVNVTLTSASTLAVGATSYAGVNQATPLGTPVSGSGNNAVPSVVVAADSGDLVVDIVGAMQVSGNGLGANQTQNFVRNQGTGVTDLFGLSSREDGAASVTMSSSFTSVNPNWAAMAVEINQAVTTVQITAAQDTTINSGSTTNYGASTSLVVDRTGGALGNGRVLLQFDFSTIPAGATITSATLQMQATANGGAFDLDIHRVTEAWVEGNGGVDAANWTQRLPGTNWTSTGGTFDPTPVATLNTAAVGQHSWNLTSLVQAWVAGSTTNNGIIIGSPNTGTTTITYDSSEGTTPPRLVVTYTVANVAPIITSNGGGANAAIDVAENTTVVTAVTATDADLPAQTISYSIVGGDDAARFNLDPVTGVLRFVTAPDFDIRGDFDADNVYDVIVRASDGALGANQAIAVTVTDVNDNAPVSAPASAAGPEDTLLAVTLNASDIDSPVASFTVQALPVNGTLYLDAARTSAVLAGTAYAAGVNALTLYFSPTADWNGSAGFAFFATDDLGLAGAVANASLTITPVNDMPVAAAASASGAEDALLPVTLRASDVDSTVASFTVQALPANGTLYLDAARTTAVLAGTAYAASADVLTLYFFPTANWNGSTSFNFFATDDLGSSSAQGTASLTITPVNDAPTLGNPLTDQTATEDAAFAYPVPGATFADVDSAAALTYSATLASGAPLPAWLSFDAGTRTFSGTPANNDVDSLTVRVTASDGSLSVFGDFILTVANSNDAPVPGTPIAAQNATEDSAYTYTLPGGSFTDVDAGATLVYTATQSSGAALPGWLNFDAGTRTFSGTPGNHDVGIITVRVTADDGAAQASQDFTLTVANANDAPTGAVSVDDTAPTQGQTLTASNSLADADGLGAITYQWQRGGVDVVGATGAIYVTTQADVGSQLRVVARYTDGQGTPESVASASTAVVANANDAPTGAVTIDDTTPTQGQILTASNSLADADGLGAIGYQWFADGAAIAGATGNSLTLGQAQVGAAISVTASYTDGFGQAERVASAATAPVANINDAPRLATAPGDQSAVLANAIAFTLPAPAFVDDDAGDTLSYTATLADGGALPAWLQFDPTTLAFSAAPGATAVGTYAIRVTASDAVGATAEARFALVVATPPVVAPVLVPTAELPLAPAASPAPAPEPVATAARAAAPASTAAAAPLLPVAPVAPGVDAPLSEAPRVPDLEPAGSAAREPADVAAGARPSSRADAVLAEALVPDFKALSLESALQLLNSEDLLRRLEETQRRLLEQGSERHEAIASTLAVTGSLSIGYVVWLVRGGVLVSSMLSALPAWQMVDPLPVVAASGAAAKRRRLEGADEPDVERLFDNRGHRVQPQPPTAPQPVQRELQEAQR